MQDAVISRPLLFLVVIVALIWIFRLIYMLERNMWEGRGDVEEAPTIVNFRLDVIGATRAYAFV